jgi:hypothetical protein
MHLCGPRGSEKETNTIGFDLEDKKKRDERRGNVLSLNSGGKSYVIVL